MIKILGIILWRIIKRWNIRKLLKKIVYYKNLKISAI